jgi:hypothetical protein
MMYIDPRMSDPAYRARTWARLDECTARQEQIRAEQDQQILNAGPQVGDEVQLSPMLRGRVVSIDGSPPLATIRWEQPTGRAGQTASRSEQRWLRDLQPAGNLPTPQNRSERP